MTHLASYLAHYCTVDAPGYALLVTGPWGCGKTYQVRAILPKDRAYYVSLFGLTTTDEVVGAIYATMFPNKARAKEIAERVSEVGADIPSVGTFAITGLTSGLINAFLRDEVADDKPIIFDDLERCGLDIKDTLGIINRYVEHHGCRVIAIAHDEKITEEFAEAKEKVFGQTIKVEPQSDVAFTKFQMALRNGSGKDLVAKYRSEILEIFAGSGVSSLRVLKHAIEDLARLTEALTAAHIAHNQAMIELTRLFTAVNVEFRNGGLDAEDLVGRQTKRENYSAHRIVSNMKKSQAEEPPKIVTAQTKYSSVDLTNTL